MRSRTTAFTLIELVVTVVVLGLLAGIALVNYRGYQDRVAIATDQTNLRILYAAIRIQASDIGSVAGSLSELTPSTLDRAFAQLKSDRGSAGLFARWAGGWRRCWGSGVAEATTFLPAQYYDRNLKVIICPSDTTLPNGFTLVGSDYRPSGGISYAISATAQNKPLSWLLNPTNGTQILIGESDTATGTVWVKRHMRGIAKVVIYVNGKTKVDTS